MSDSNISCIRYSWSSNSLGQNPCDIAERLNAVCTTTNDSYFSALTSDTDYTLSSEEQNSCLCTTVVYSLVSLCRLCQTQEGKLYSTWDQWIGNCSTANTGFPMGLPGGTAVPDWAYQNVSETGAFNESLAATVATTDHTESFSSASPSSTMPPSNSTQASGLGTSDNHAGAIAGGLIGGLAGLALLAAAIWFFMKRRKRSKMPPSVAYLRSSRNLTDATSRGHYAPVISKNEREAPFLPISIVRSSQDRSSILFDPSIYTDSEMSKET